MRNRTQSPCVAGLTVVIHKLCLCSWEELTSQGVKILLHWLHVELFLLNAPSAWKKNKPSYSLPQLSACCLGWIINQALKLGKAKCLLSVFCSLHGALAPLYSPPCFNKMLCFQYICMLKCTYILKFWCCACFGAEERERWMCPVERS